MWNRLGELGLKPSKRLFIGTVHSFCLACVVAPFGHLFREDLKTELVVAGVQQKERALEKALETLGLGGHTSPRQYFYESVLGLSRRREDSGYVMFHRCVYRVLRWMAEERASGNPIDEAAALAYLADVWEEQGPEEHPFKELYRTSAVNLVERAARRPFTSQGSSTRPTWEVSVPLGVIRFVPDHVEVLSDGSEVIERLRTGRPTKSERDKDIYALYVKAALDAEPRVRRTVQVRYLSADQVDPVDLRPRTVDTRLNHYNDAIRGILRRDFAPEPNDRNCPRCPHYFICPVGEDA